MEFFIMKCIQYFASEIRAASTMKLGRTLNFAEENLLRNRSPYKQKTERIT